MGAIRGAAALVGLAGLFGAAANLCLPSRLPWIRTPEQDVRFDAEEIGLKALDPAATVADVRDNRRLVLDARSANDYRAGHIPGALSVPYDHAETAVQDIQMLLTSEQPVLVYCSDGSCRQSLLLGKFLRDRGCLDVALLSGGMDGWTRAGHPVERGG